MDKKVIVTCGGTTEHIDDVRVLTNISTGRFGHQLASELAKIASYEVTEYSPSKTTAILGKDENVTYKTFSTAETLTEALTTLENPAIIIQAAAVSDYRPVPTPGKIASNKDTLSLTLERVPKILPTLRSTYGSKTFLVGFKLLSGATEKELITAAQQQLKENKLNMVVANDLQHLKNGEHPVLVITAEGGVIPFTGRREEVVADLAQFIGVREQVNWFKSIQREAFPYNPALESRFKDTLALAKELHLLTDEAGNISARSSRAATRLLVSPRGINKQELSLENSLHAEASLANREIFYAGEGKPSIDTGMETILYDAYENIDTIIHFHRGWGVMNATTGFPYPCGVVEEGAEIITSNNLANISLETKAFGTELVHHGFILGLAMSEIGRIRREWFATLNELSKHFATVEKANGSVPRPNDESLYRPIWHGASIVGVIYDDPQAAVVYLRANARGQGVGKAVIEQLIERRYTIATVDECEVRDFYKTYGFTETFANGRYFLKAPSTPLARTY